jgi:RNA polymerase sigma-70 factor (ECF subfamily)
MDADTRRGFEAEALAHVEALYATAVRLTGSRADADDLCQEAILRAYQRWDRFESGTNCRAWLTRILVNSFINGYRRRVRERRLLDVATDPTREEAFFSAEARRGRGPDGGIVPEGLDDELHAALDALAPEFRAVVVLVDLEEMSYQEAARTLSCPLGTVMSRLHRARAQLRRRIARPGRTQALVAVPAPA